MRVERTHMRSFIESQQRKKVTKMKNNYYYFYFCRAATAAASKSCRNLLRSETSLGVTVPPPIVGLDCLSDVDGICRRAIA